MPDFLHDQPGFKALVENVAKAENIPQLVLVEKDYWIMHALWGLTRQGFKFELKGGTSLSKGYQLIHRFSEDIDIQIHPPESMVVHSGKNRNKKAHVESRKAYFDWLAGEISVPGITGVTRALDFDDPRYYRNAGIALAYNSHFDPAPGIKNEILLEAGFDKTQPNEPLTISSWVYDHGAPGQGGLIDNRAVGIVCYRPEYTFVEKLSAIIRKFRQFLSDGKIRPNFLRHYYDIYMLLGCEDVQSFIGTDEYLQHKAEKIRGADKEFGLAAALDILRPELEAEYASKSNLYYRGQIPLAEIVERVKSYLDRL